jgi:hypothetical protein
MSYSRSESTYCVRCKQFVRWSDNDPEDDKFSGGIDKLVYHIKNDKVCLRIQNLAEILGEETDLLGCLKHLI